MNEFVVLTQDEIRRRIRAALIARAGVLDAHGHLHSPSDGKFIAKGIADVLKGGRAGKRPGSKKKSSPPTAPKPARTAQKPLDRMDLDELSDEFAAESAKKRPSAQRLQRMFDEMGKREDVIKRDAEARGKIDANLAKGMSYLDAYADAYDLDPRELEQEHLKSLVDAQRQSGESREKTVRRLYDEAVTLAYLQAESATRGHLVHPKSRGKVDARRLFSGPAAYAHRHASDELREWWETHPRLTYAEFKAMMLGTGKAEAQRIKDRARDFGR